MASAPEPFLSCRLCQSVPSDPVVLSCSHCFCRVCLQKDWEDRETRKCPVCGRRSSVEWLPPFMSSESPGHQSERVCRLHGEELSVFCSDHQEALCVVCREEHADHRLRPIAEAVPYLRDKLLVSLPRLKSRLQLLDKAELELRDTDRFISAQAKDTEKLIQEQFQKLHRLLQEEEESRVRAVREEEAQRRSSLRDKRSALRQEKTAVRQIIRDTEEELGLRDTEEELRDTEEELRDTEEELRDTEEELRDTEEELQKLGLRDTEEELRDTEEELTYRDTEEELRDTEEELTYRDTEEELTYRDTEEELRDTEEELQKLGLRDTEEELQEVPSEQPLDLSLLLRYKSLVERVERPLQEEEPQLGSGALLDQAQHLGNLGFHIWTSLRSQVQYSPVVLDPDTAHPKLTLSEDLTSVRFGERQNRPQNPERLRSNLWFTLGSEGLTAGVHSWDVDVSQNRDWALGVATKSPQSQGGGVLDRVWRLWFWRGTFRWWTQPGRPTALPASSSDCDRVRVVLDLDRGDLSFYDLDCHSLIHSHSHPFTGETLFPYFYTHDPNPLRVLPQGVRTRLERDLK